VQKLKRKSWSISKNSRIWRIKTPADRMNLLVQALHKEESKEYFTLPKSPDYNEDGRLESNKEDHYSHRKMLRNGKSNVIKDLE
jgi:hypothetical protein